MPKLIPYTLSAMFLFTGVSALSQEATPTPIWMVAKDYEVIYELMDYLRQERKEHLFVPVAKLQLIQLIDSANQLEATEPDHATETRRFARGVAYNVASFTWPGWGDSPQPISQADQELGLLAAKVGLGLAHQINEPTPNIYWILGAHQLNAKQYKDAIESFENGKALARNDFYRSMHDAWQIFTRTLASEEASFDELDTAIENLRAADDENAAFFADQLVTAKGVYFESVE